MNNGSERTRIVNHAENVPVRWGQDGPVVGTARVSDNGEIHVSLDRTIGAGLTLYSQIMLDDVIGAISIAPAVGVPKYSDEVRDRLAEQNPFKKEN